MQSEMNKSSIGTVLLGIAMVMFGLFALSSVFSTTLASVFIFGILLIVSGIIQVFLSFVYREVAPVRFSLSLLAGILYAVAGFFTLSNPVMSLSSITLLLALLLVTVGLFRIIVALAIHGESWGWVLIGGIISLVLGVMIYNQWPASSFWVVGTFIGIELVSSGLSWLISPHKMGHA